MILVAGSTGLIGEACVRLMARKYPIVALANRTVPTFPDVEVRQASLLDSARLASCLRGISTVIYAPSFSTPKTTPLNLRIEVENTLQALSNLIESLDPSVRRPHIVFASTAGAIYGSTDDLVDETAPVRPLNSYGAGKELSETMLGFHARNGRIDYTILRFSNLYGFHGRRRVAQSAIDVFLDNALSGIRSNVWADDSSTRDYLHADDAAHAVAAVLDSPDAARNRTFNVASGVNTTMSEILDIVDEVTGGRHLFSRVESVAPSPSHTRIDASRFRQAFPAWPVPVSVREGVAAAWRSKLEHRMAEASHLSLEPI